MKLNLTFISAALFLTGCASGGNSIEYVRQNPKKQAVVRYIPVSGDVQTDYLAMVDKEASGFCGGSYKINSNYKALSDSKISEPVDVAAKTFALNSSESHLTSYDYVEFACN